MATLDPNGDWPPLVDLEPTSFVESEGERHAVPFVDGRGWIVLEHGVLYLERASHERVLLLGPAVVEHGEVSLELAPAGEASVRPGRVAYSRGASVTEWYEPTVNGIEQGWTVETRPVDSGSGLRVHVRVGDEVEAEQVAAPYVTLRVGEDVLEYRALMARDARDHELPSSMTLLDDEIVLDIDDGGAEYPVTIDPYAVSTTYFLQPAVGLRDTDYGRSASVYGNVAVVGEPDEPAGTGVVGGAVHVFRRGTNNAWVAERTIRMGAPPAESSAAQFGQSVDVWGNLLVVGAPGESTGRGAVYLIALNGSFDSLGRPYSGSFLRFVAPTRTISQDFGWSVAISQYRMIVGGLGLFAPNAYTFYYGPSWHYEATIPTGANPGGLFGSVVDIDPHNPNLAVVGAPSYNGGAGEVYVYYRPVCCWPPTPTILSAPAYRTRFGSSVAVSDGQIVIGSLYNGNDANILRSWWTGSTWYLSGGYLASGTMTTDSSYSFSYNTSNRQPHVAISDGMQVLGFPNAAPSGAPATNVEGTVTAINVSGLAQTGYSGAVNWRHRGQTVALDGSTALIGRRDYGLGSVRAYNIRLTNGSACTQSDGSECVSGHCVDGVCCNSTCGNGVTNDCMACSTARGGTLNGTCTALSSSYAPTVQCRAASGSCDVADYCSSTTMSCPFNYANSATVCRSASQPCELDTRCTGSSPACPSTSPYAPSTTVCRTATELCELDARCTGTSYACPANAPAAAGTLCDSTVAGPCDVVDVCDGSSFTCPERHATAGTSCGSPPSGPCDIQDACDGFSDECQSLWAAAGTVCLAANGACDQNDVCTGTSSDCPALYLSGNVCRAAVDECDIAESCDGLGADCPVDQTLPMCVPEICGNGVDDDLDALLDCYDVDDCASDGSCGTTELSCDDGVDNDIDGVIDCADASECPNGSVCDALGDHICVDGACVLRGCGDGYREPGSTPPREGCDDGNATTGDACTSCAPTLLQLWSASGTESSPGRRTPSMSEDGLGEILFVFTEDDGHTRKVRARRVTSRGVLDGAPIDLASVGSGWDAQPSVAGLSGGGWVVVWTDPTVDGDQSGIAARKVYADGHAGPVIGVDAGVYGVQRDPRVAALGSGWVVVWTDESGLDGPLGESVIRARRFTTAGAATEDDWSVSEGGRVASQPALTVSGTRWAVAWTDAPAWTSGGDVVSARRFGGSGDDGAPFVATEAGFDGSEPAITTLISGEFALVWVQRTNDPLGDIATRIIASSGDPLVASVVGVLTGRDAYDHAYSQGAPAIAALDGSRYVVAYEDDGARQGVAFTLVGGGAPAAESTALADDLVDGWQGDVSLLRTDFGVWFAWSDARLDAPVDPGAYRSTLAYLLALD